MGGAVLWFIGGFRREDLELCAGGLQRGRERASIQRLEFRRAGGEAARVFELNSLAAISILGAADSCE